MPVLALLTPAKVRSIPVYIAGLSVFALAAVIAGSGFPGVVNCVLLFLILVLLMAMVATHRNVRPDQIEHEHQLMVETVRQYPMPLAIYDVDDRLMVWNDAYESLYENAFSSLEYRQKNKPVYYLDLISSNVPQELNDQERESYIQGRLVAQRESTGEAIDRNYPSKGWFRVSKYRTPSGAVAGFAIDINELKDREHSLIEEVERRKKLETKILDLAYSDELTGIANRRAILEHAQQEFERCKDDGGHLSILMMDIDHFKLINDQYGHSIGDLVIKSVCQAVDRTLRQDTDKIGRFGGEEFVVVVLRTTAPLAEILADRIRRVVEDLVIDAGGESLRVTVSIGVAQLNPGDTELIQVINRADASLYDAKTSGRNRIRAA